MGGVGRRRHGGVESERGRRRAERGEESSEREKISYEFVSDFGYHVRIPP